LQPLNLLELELQSHLFLSLQRLALAPSLLGLLLSLPILYPPKYINEYWGTFKVMFLTFCIFWGWYIIFPSMTIQYLKKKWIMGHISHRTYPSQCLKLIFRETKLCINPQRKAWDDRR
jgi:hypothetical protein